MASSVSVLTLAEGLSGRAQFTCGDTPTDATSPAGSPEGGMHADANGIVPQLHEKPTLAPHTLQGPDPLQANGYGADRRQGLPSNPAHHQGSVYDQASGYAYSGQGSNTHSPAPSPRGYGRSNPMASAPWNAASGSMSGAAASSAPPLPCSSASMPMTMLTGKGVGSSLPSGRGHASTAGSIAALSSAGGAFGAPGGSVQSEGGLALELGLAGGLPSRRQSTHDGLLPLSSAGRPDLALGGTSPPGDAFAGVVSCATCTDTDAVDAFSRTGMCRR